MTLAAWFAGGIGTRPIAGYHPAVIVPSQDELGVPFLMGNDRYQIIVCSDSGTSSSSPSWRYWYAGGAPWGEALALDLNNPTFYTTDENGDPVMASLELPFREVKTNQNILVTGVLVEFTPQPMSLDPTSTANVAMSIRVEGYGLPDYTAVTSGGGVARSETLSFSESVGIQPDDPWPNVRTIHFPCRMNIRLRSARVVITDLSLMEINRVTLLGTISAQRVV